MKLTLSGRMWLEENQKDSTAEMGWPPTQSTIDSGIKVEKRKDADADADADAGLGMGIWGYGDMG